LTSELPDTAIAQTLARERDPSVAATRLVEEAVAAGGHDNVTVVVVDVLTGDEDDEDVGDTARGIEQPESEASLGLGHPPEPIGKPRGRAARRSRRSPKAKPELIVEVPGSASAPQGSAGGGDQESNALIAEVPTRNGDEGEPETGGMHDG
jgi:hypothetical protein